MTDGKKEERRPAPYPLNPDGPRPDKVRGPFLSKVATALKVITASGLIYLWAVGDGAKKTEVEVHPTSISKPDAKEDVDANRYKKEREASVGALNELLVFFADQDKLKDKNAFFKSNPTSLEMCTFSDQWYGNPEVRKNLHVIWKYLDSRAEREGDIVKAEDGALSIAGSLPWLIRTGLAAIGKPVPSDRKEMQAKIRESLVKVPDGSTSCGAAFNMIHGILVKEKKMDEVKRMFVNLFVGSAKSILRDLKRLEHEKRLGSDEERKLIETTGALLQAMKKAF